MGVKGKPPRFPGHNSSEKFRDEEPLAWHTLCSRSTPPQREDVVGRQQEVQWRNKEDRNIMPTQEAVCTGLIQLTL